MGSRRLFFRPFAMIFRMILDQKDQHRRKDGGTVAFDPVNDLIVHSCPSLENDPDLGKSLFDGVGVKVEVIAFIGTLFILHPGEKHIVLGKIGV